MTDEELDRLADDLAAVAEPGPALGEFGPALYGLTDDEDDDPR